MIITISSRTNGLKKKERKEYMRVSVALATAFKYLCGLGKEFISNVFHPQMVISIVN